ncbi:alpha/beta fold hydrolase [Pseudomonas sp. P66]|jgi:predicted alpha/beta hydrolase|uniref:Alpha/beta fold hydrolase n=1 Tax=Pseudomonas arcuscaelestis TaxID=2710591 RepID=A0ABS2C0M9_9PSED|nr:alpha/beta fold hydrolase [Pseudomonas arcuscaelestis]MBM3107523.1 alpha/beta fold hydrolase [Pseudomonas arcuscaelestis]MBM3113482.1 alpha/beta fold hydrolase [Pseudomonas arcuscaelestis]MBM5459435.1 alpha/beta fold hydrolase [Pseudomonas arcuscaelestis]
MSSLEAFSPLLAASSAAQAFREAASDGYSIGGFSWRHPLVDSARPVVIINAATSVRCSYYARFAQYLFSHGFDVMTYDYRGIGESRPASMRNFKATWTDWGVLDFEAVLQRARREFPGQPIDVVGHSFGGCAAGLAASSTQLRRLVTVGAQFAYWRDYAADSRWQLFGKWHVVMPLLTQLFGYFPGKRLGWLEDTPAGVVKDWSTLSAAYERRPSGKALVERPFAQFRAQTLAISLTDDPFGTVAAIERLLSYCASSSPSHLRIAPADIGEAQIGHFAFFHNRFETRLWPIALQWLQHGQLADGAPGRLLALSEP